MGVIGYQMFKGMQVLVLKTLMQNIYFAYVWISRESEILRNTWCGSCTLPGLYFLFLKLSRTILTAM
jgi:hypothetical protein